MKTMNCNDLGGACNTEFHAETWLEMAEKSKAHAMEMAEKRDSAHLEAMDKMGELMKDSDAMDNWFKSKENEFNMLSNS